MKRTYFLLFSTLLLLTGCVDFNDTTPPVVATIQIVMPEGFANVADLSGYSVTLQSDNESLTATTNAAGQAVFADIAPGVYNVSVSANLTHSQYEQLTGQTVGGDMEFMLTGTLNQQVLSQDKSLALPITIYPLESLIIGKVYASNSKIEGGTYSIGKYIELYNNSDATVDAAGLYIGLLESESTVAYKVYPYESATTPGILHVKQVFRIPAEPAVPVEPGQTLLLVNSATDHRGQNDYESDLRSADFEAKDANKKIPNNEQVAALELVYSTYSSISCMNLVQGGPTALVIFRTDEDVSQWNTVYADGKTRGNLFMEVPTSCVLDGVEIVKNRAQTGPDINTKRVFQDIDAGYTFVASAAGTTGERLVRKTLNVATDGRKILQDTNNSSNDFVCTDTISPRNYLEP